MHEVLCGQISSSWGGLRLLAETVINKFEYILASIVVKTYIHIFTKLNLMTFQGLSEKITFNSLLFLTPGGFSETDNILLQDTGLFNNIHSIWA